TRFLDFAVGFEEIAGIDTSKSSKILESAQNYLSQKKTNQVDTPEIGAIKGLIRRGEAKATCRYVGIKDENIHFLNLPFYETGAIEKKPMSEEDVKITTELFEEIKQNTHFAAGDLADPHGTHKVCLDILLGSL